MTDHERCQELLLFYTDDLLSEEERSFVEKHITECSLCAKSLAQIQQMNTILDIWAQEEIAPPEGFHQELMKRLTQVSEKLVPIEQKKSWFSQRRHKIVSLALAAAVLLMMPVVYKELAKNSFVMIIPIVNHGTGTDNEQTAQRSTMPEDIVSIADNGDTKGEQKQIIQQRSSELGASTENSSTANEPAEDTAESSVQQSTAPENNIPMLLSSSVPEIENSEEIDSEEVLPKAASVNATLEDELEWDNLEKQTKETLDLLKLQRKEIETNNSNLSDKELEASLAEIDQEIKKNEQVLTAINNKDKEAYEKLVNN